ncbi:DUF2291 domain-containing protein [Pantoea stewartii subsp. indologenes]|uniref:DUF2291 family protein n=1 Tax=Pantoea stewartii TaxID=66269 RepID=UPI001980B7D1|nr:DUF2291 domain-containing protein [Pantoea stewartii]MDK2635289.1 DUF2291 domain-containing protein [Pantoea stewartii subsp. indologenes]
MYNRLCLILVTAALSGCRVVSQQELADLKNPPNPHMANIHALWQQKLVPQIVAQARPLGELMQRLQAEKDLDSACKALGYRSQSENPCVFSVSVSGDVTALETTSRNGKMKVKDASGDTVTIQTGPIIRGTALRDAYKGTSYQDFNNQDLFSDFGKAINQQAVNMMKDSHIKTGDHVQVVGVFSSWDIPRALPAITPAQITRQ